LRLHSEARQISQTQTQQKWEQTFDSTTGFQNVVQHTVTIWETTEEILMSQTSVMNTNLTIDFGFTCTANKKDKLTQRTRQMLVWDTTGACQWSDWKETVRGDMSRTYSVSNSINRFSGWLPVNVDNPTANMKTIREYVRNDLRINPFPNAEDVALEEYNKYVAEGENLGTGFDYSYFQLYPDGYLADRGTVQGLSCSYAGYRWRGYWTTYQADDCRTNYDSAVMDESIAMAIQSHVRGLAENAIGKNRNNNCLAAQRAWADRVARYPQLD
jgi:hypothetical protein